jgi:hypothetical protein
MIHRKLALAKVSSPEGAHHSFSSDGKVDLTKNVTTSSPLCLPYRFFPYASADQYMYQTKISESCQTTSNLYFRSYITSHPINSLKNAFRYPHELLQIRSRELYRPTAPNQTCLDSTHTTNPLPVQAHLRLATCLRHLRAAVRQHDDFRRLHGHAHAHGDAVQRPRCRQHHCLGGNLGLDWWCHWAGYHGIS